LAHDRLAIGLTAVAAMLCGVIFTLVSFSLTAVLLRERASFALERSERWRHHIGFGLELASGSAVVLLGITMLIGALGRP
jgi:ABC-type nickel/cobalt efflux system permease component RcnA